MKVSGQSSFTSAWPLPGAPLSHGASASSAKFDLQKLIDSKKSEWAEPAKKPKNLFDVLKSSLEAPSKSSNPNQYIKDKSVNSTSSILPDIELSQKMGKSVVSTLRSANEWLTYGIDSKIEKAPARQKILGNYVDYVA